MNVQYCEEHRNLGDADGCFCGPNQYCRMVPMRLIPDNEETVERIAEAIHSKDEGSYVGDWSKLAEWRKEEYRQWAVPVLVALVGETP